MEGSYLMRAGDAGQGQRRGWGPRQTTFNHSSVSIRCPEYLIHSQNSKSAAARVWPSPNDELLLHEGLENFTERSGG